ncbi:MAG: macro domain-containing protein, partial [Candidatus Natronoplasma sp.]
MRKSTMIEGAKLELVQGDLTSQNTDAVVNSANRRLAPGVGVTGEIHDAAGPELYEECKRLGKIDIGEAVVTNGYRLPVNHIIHTVAPIYSGYEKDEGELRKSFRNSLKVAVENGVKSVSFPAINTVAY